MEKIKELSEKLSNKLKEELSYKEELIRKKEEREKNKNVIPEKIDKINKEIISLNKNIYEIEKNIKEDKEKKGEWVNIVKVETNLKHHLEKQIEEKKASKLELENMNLKSLYFEKENKKSIKDSEKNIEDISKNIKYFETKKFNDVNELDIKLQESYKICEPLEDNTENIKIIKEAIASSDGRRSRGKKFHANQTSDMREVIKILKKRLKSKRRSKRKLKSRKSRK